jgi:hypothetical protein
VDPASRVSPPNVRFEETRSAWRMGVQARSRPFDRGFICLHCGRSEANASADGWNETATAFVRVTLRVTHRRKKPENRGSMRLAVRCSIDPSPPFQDPRMSQSIHMSPETAKQINPWLFFLCTRKGLEFDAVVRRPCLHDPARELGSVVGAGDAGQPTLGAGLIENARDVQRRDRGVGDDLHDRLASVVDDGQRLHAPAIGKLIATGVAQRCCACKAESQKTNSQPQGRWWCVSVSYELCLSSIDLRLD